MLRSIAAVASGAAFASATTYFSESFACECKGFG